MNYVRIKEDYSVGNLSKQSQSKTPCLIYLFLYSLPDSIKSENENANIPVITFLRTYKYGGNQPHRNTTRTIEEKNRDYIYMYMDFLPLN